MTKRGKIGLGAGAAAIAAAAFLTPALAEEGLFGADSASFYPGGFDFFTPAVADPKLAAEYERRGLDRSSLSFTPAEIALGGSKEVRVAMRANNRAAQAAVEKAPRAVAAQIPALAESASGEIAALPPTAYNLGVGVGWQRFALTGDVARVEGGPVPGGREKASAGVSYREKKFTGRVQLEADRATTATPRALQDSSYSLDVAGSYSLTRNLKVTGGVQYKIERERLEPLADTRQDSQSVYIGTVLKF
ncbi:MAG: hypothetical protein ACFBQW_06725 [Sphingomonadaceae bacterium]